MRSSVPRAPHRRTVRGVTRRICATSSGVRSPWGTLRSVWNPVVAMRTQDRDEDSARTRTFRETLPEPSWTLDGDGLSSTDRREFKPQLAAITMIDALT